MDRTYERMRGVGARSLFAALRPGGFALVKTMNVQGARRDELEAPLVAAGFVLPYHEQSRIYRAEIAATGIYCVEILGGLRARSDRRDDQARLDALMQAHARRCEAAAGREQARCADPQARIVNIAYSTS